MVELDGDAEHAEPAEVAEASETRNDIADGMLSQIKCTGSSGSFKLANVSQAVTLQLVEKPFKSANHTRRK